MAVEEATGMSASKSLASLFSDETDGAELAAAPPPKGIQAADRLMAAPPEAVSQNAVAAQAALPFTAKGGPKFFALEGRPPSAADSIAFPRPSGAAAISNC